MFLLEDDTPEGPETNLSSSGHAWAFINHGRESPIAFNLPLISVLNEKENIATSVGAINRTHDPIQIVSTTIPTKHPCENFPLPPLPIDIKHRGPRRKLL